MTKSKSILFACYKVLYKLLWTQNLVRRVRGKHVSPSLYGSLNLCLAIPHLVQYNPPGDIFRWSHNLSLLIQKPEFVTCYPHLVRFNPPLARSVWCVHPNWGLLCQSIPISSRGSGEYPQPPGAYVVFPESDSGFAHPPPVYWLCNKWKPQVSVSLSLPRCWNFHWSLSNHPCQQSAIFVRGFAYPPKEFF